MHTEMHKDLAWTIYHNKADITINGNFQSVKWVETVILKKRNEHWKIKLLHSTPAF